jgi:hypothetical protein
MLRWRFETYVSPTGRNDIQTEVDGYDEYSKAAFERAVKHLAVTPKEQWNEPHAKKLKNEDPIYEIRYKANNRSTRALGYFGNDGVTFIVLLICFHKGRVYTPPDAFKSAHRRRRHHQDSSATSVPLQSRGESFPSDEG